MVLLYCYGNLAYQGLIINEVLEKIFRKKRKHKEGEELVLSWTGRSIVLAGVVCFLLTAVIEAVLYQSLSILNYIKLSVLYAIVLTGGIIDWKLKIIPNRIVLTGAIFRLLCYVPEIVLITEFNNVILNDLIGFGIGFGLLLIVSIVSRQSLGMGDVKLFGVIGMTIGGFGTYSTLFASVLCSTIVSVVLLVFRKHRIKDSIPFGPCILLGYVLTILLGSY